MGISAERPVPSVEAASRLFRGSGRLAFTRDRRWEERRALDQWILDGRARRRFPTAMTSGQTVHGFRSRRRRGPARRRRRGGLGSVRRPRPWPAPLRTRFFGPPGRPIPWPLAPDPGRLGRRGQISSLATLVGLHDVDPEQGMEGRIVSLGQVDGAADSPPSGPARLGRNEDLGANG